MENIYVKIFSLKPVFFPINPKYSSSQSVPFYRVCIYKCDYCQLPCFEREEVYL